jgi:hypothetical protein
MRGKGLAPTTHMKRWCVDNNARNSDLTATPALRRDGLLNLLGRMVYPLITRWKVAEPLAQCCATQLVDALWLTGEDALYPLACAI